MRCTRTGAACQLTISFVYDDGGRKAAGFKGTTGDCGVRAVAIATGEAYRTVYDQFNELAKTERITKRQKTRSNARTGIRRPTMHRYMRSIGWAWVPTMLIGSGCKVHVAPAELPSGRLVLNLSEHYAAFVDGQLRDIYDCSRDGTRCVYGYWHDPQRRYEREVRAGLSVVAGIMAEGLG